MEAPRAGPGGNASSEYPDTQPETGIYYAHKYLFANTRSDQIF